MIMRLYWPTRTILAGTWQPPGVERVSDRLRDAEAVSRSPSPSPPLHPSTPAGTP